jgi:superfamily I DNA/RNA helicase
MPIIQRAIGGAGTGKTRLILDRLSAAKREMRLSVDEIGFCTFTRAGRQEIADRAAEAWCVDVEALTGGWFRTAHSIAYRQCGIEEGQLIQGKDGDDWMSMVLGGTVNTRIDSRGEKTYVAGGDDTIPIALRAWELARSTVKPLSHIVEAMVAAGEPCPSYREIESVIEKYERGKRTEGKVDYTDMIAKFAGVKFGLLGPEMVEPSGEAPENLRILAIDEAQDSSALVDLVCRRLAYSGRTERIWLCGDPYQSIHGFAGGDYRHFLTWDAAESVMPQSFRCPDNVLRLGERCLRRMLSGYRDRGILPASHEGSVSSATCAEDAISRLPTGESTLILGRCAFSLAEYEAVLASRGIPHCWIDKTHGVASLSAYQALWSLQHGQVATGEGWGNAVSMMGVNSKEFGPILARGEKAAWTSGRRTQIDLIRPTDEDLAMAGAEPALVSLVREGRWHLAMEAKHRERTEQWLRTATKHGPDVASNPTVKLSTIHGAKGLEAENVILSSITSPRIERARMNLPESHDEECRIEYVAVTRARRNFIYVQDGFRYRMELPV